MTIHMKDPTYLFFWAKSTGGSLVNDQITFQDLLQALEGLVFCRWHTNLLEEGKSELQGTNTITLIACSK